MEKIKISIVNYTNTLPFKWALKQSELIKKIDLQEDIPSICGQKLKFKQVDLALMPVAMLTELDTFFIETDFCIGANGRVDSVKLYSRVPLDEIKTVTLDYQSRSSITLTKVLFKSFWKKEVSYIDAKPGFEQQIVADNAAVVIGDRTFSLNGKFEYEYDLAEEWKKYTGLPFVFAAWVSTEKLPLDFVKAFNAVLKYGIEHMAEAVNDAEAPKNLNKEKTLAYLTDRIDYRLDGDKRKALDRFLSEIKSL
ncbi:MAG TPA: menaquinone biosynthesis protein [Bacteroidia bacterium]|nr:menaquinone biosynthesis protein [Bacteroidia bacterium]